MNFEEFSKQVTILQGDKALVLRNSFISKFVNTDSEYYKSRILAKFKFSDGDYYTGYLWEILKSPNIISEEELLLKIKRHNNKVFVLWDIHSSQRIVRKDYWKFPREAILLLHTNALLSGINELPEDIYIFDDSFKWSLIQTHESTKSEKRLCYVI